MILILWFYYFKLNVDCVGNHRCSRRFTRLSVDSNDSLWPAYLRLRFELPWLKNLSPAKTKGALATVCTPTLKSVLGKETISV